MSKSVINIGPYHPLQEEAEFFQLYVDGETVVDVDVRISYNHRGICSASHPLAYIQAVEEIAGVQIPPRAAYLRTIVNELERIHSHMLWVGLAGHFLGYNTVFMWAWKYREPIMDALEISTGSRVNYANCKIGGVRRDMTDEQLKEVSRICEATRGAVEMLTGAVVDDPVLHARTKGVGTLKKADAKAYGAVGPTARASGIAIDVRRDDPYAAYDKLDWKVITDDAGDVFAKAKVRLLETIESINMVKQAIKDMPTGDLDAKVEAIPPGEACGHVEAPRGETFHYVRADGSNYPARHKIRAPSYVNVPTFKASCIGQQVADVAITLAAVDPCYSCTERACRIVDASSGKQAYTFDQLVKLSREKTEKIRRQC